MGAGLRGLASADYLQSAGAEVQIFEKEPRLGGVWQKVHAGAQVNTPAFAYTFHASNRWHSAKPSRGEIHTNLQRLVTDSGLQDAIRFNTPVEQVQKTASGGWTVNGSAEAFDGVLVCPGFLGRRKHPPPELCSAFEGQVARAYEVEPGDLREKNVVVVGSGSSALDMLTLAHKSKCRQASLFIRPGIEIRDVNRFEPLKLAIASNPLIYRLTKRPGGDPAAVCAGIDDVINSKQVCLVHSEIQGLSAGHVHPVDGDSIKADCIIWCTGWESPVPGWARKHQQDPTLVLASCRHCLDTAGFGFGAATVHAKALMATLQHGLEKPFNSGTSHCDCEQETPGFSRHILLNLAQYYLSQPQGWRILGKGLQHGFRNNRNRMREMEEPTWASLLAFVNAPFGF